MRSFFLTGLVLVVLLVLQTTLVPLISVKQITPDILLLYVVFRGIREGRTRSVILGFCAGLLQDLAGTGPAGIVSLATAVAAFLSCSLPINRFEKNVWMVGAVLLTASVVQQIIIIAFVGGESAFGFFGMVFRYGIPSALYTFCLGWIWTIAFRLRARRFEEVRR